MLYCIYGTETEKTRLKKNEIVFSCQKKRPDAELFLLDMDNFSAGALESLYSSQGLFEQKHIVILDKLLSFKETREIISGVFPNLALSPSIFIFLESSLDAKMLALVKKYAEKWYFFGEQKETKKKDFSVFSITDAFASKDKRSAWINYQKSIRMGNTPEAIHGALFWQMKTIFLAKKTGEYNRFSKNFSEKELDGILEQLVKMYHEIRSSGGELEYVLEKFLLVNPL